MMTNCERKLWLKRNSPSRFLWKRTRKSNHVQSANRHRKCTWFELCHKINWNALPENDSLLPLSAWRAYNVSSSFQHIFDHRDGRIKTMNINRHEIKQRNKRTDREIRKWCARWKMQMTIAFVSSESMRTETDKICAACSQSQNNKLFEITHLNK